MGTQLAIDGERLTLRQYVGLLGQEYHLCFNAPINLRLAAGGLEEDEPGLAMWLRRRADDLERQHRWALEDLEDLGAVVPRVVPATERYLERVRSIAAGDQPWGVLAMCRVADIAAAGGHLRALLPRGTSDAARLAYRRARIGPAYLDATRRLIARLGERRTAEVNQLVLSLGQSYAQFLAGALESLPRGSVFCLRELDDQRLTA